MNDFGRPFFEEVLQERNYRSLFDRNRAIFGFRGTTGAYLARNTYRRASIDQIVDRSSLQLAEASIS
jgi:hypothetical protein